jgi:hypothetical protein
VLAVKQPISHVMCALHKYASFQSFDYLSG